MLEWMIRLAWLAIAWACLDGAFILAWSRVVASEDQPADQEVDRYV